MRICNVCLKNDFLCNACNKKVVSGHISKTDVDVSRAVYKLGIDADFLKSLVTDDYYVVVADKSNSGLLIGRGGRNAKRISTMLGKNLRIIEHTNDEKDLVENIIGVPVMGINKVYSGKESYKIRVDPRFRKRAESLSPLVNKILNKNVKFVFD